jgi:ribosomal protein S6
MSLRIPSGSYHNGALATQYTMSEEETHADNMSVYEIGYLITSSIPEEKIAGEAVAITQIITSAGSTIIADEAPHRIKLAYEMRKKNVSGSYEKYNEAYFGWIKFEVGSDSVETLKKSVEIHPSVLRMLLTTTVRENTYLGKGASVVAAEIFAKKETTTDVSGEAEGGTVEVKKETIPVSVEEMDKSIDEMVKEA